MQTDLYRPPADHPLAPYIYSIWRVAASGSHVSEMIMPKGTVDILFNAGPPQRVDNAHTGASVTIRRSHIAGLHTGAVTATPQGSVHMVGVSLRAEGCAALLRLPMHELTDTFVDGEAVLPALTPHWEQVGALVDFEAQCRLLVRWLVALIRPSQQTELIHHACRSLHAAPCDHTLDRIAGELHLSARHLRRLFLEHVGVGPTQYLQIRRFVHALHIMEQPMSLTQIALEACYFDQAHFCRDFKSIAAMTPGEYRQRMGHVIGHLFDQ